MAVVGGDGRVVACSASARAVGVRRRMRLRQAQSRCPDLHLVERDLAAETRMFETVVRHLEAEVMPRLEVIRPGLVAAAARGPARYWGGEEQLVARISTELAGAGYPVRSGIADTVFAAALAARTGSGILVPAGTAAGLLAPYPVAVLGRPQLTDVLIRLGVSTLGAFAALPPDRVLARFGADGTAAQRTAQGREPRLLATRGAATDLAVRQVFEHGEQRLDALAFAAKSLAVELHERLAASGVTAARFAIEVRLADGRTWERVWRHEGRLSSLAVAERVRWQLQAWADDADALRSGLSGMAVVQLTLRPDDLSTATGHQQLLFGERSTPEDVARAASQVQAMLGHRAVLRAELTGGRGPADRVVRVPVGDTTPPARAAGPGPWPGRIPAPYPATVYLARRPARLLDADGQEVQISGRLAVSAAPASLTIDGVRDVLQVSGWSAPWPVLEQWWDRQRARRIARLQVTTDGGAWLLQLDGGRWWAEAHYG